MNYEALGRFSIGAELQLDGAYHIQEQFRGNGLATCIKRGTGFLARLANFFKESLCGLCDEPLSQFFHFRIQLLADKSRDIADLHTEFCANLFESHLLNPTPVLFVPHLLALMLLKPLNL
jgi:hypothetical protein